ncbi:uncharacterized protein KIAA1958-like [Mytilus edulis]|uniref:uncharacterized protein KIAA1958-like n=1 Tax=Mytilus edulis TaxID=6550 RepID=UPI0039F0968D
MDGFHHELSEDDMILSQVLETLEDEMELRNVNIEDFFGEFPSNVMDENASGDLINTSAVSFDLGLDLDLWLQVPSENGKIQNVKDEEPKDQEQGVESRFAEMTDNEIDTLIEGAENKNTKKATKWAVNVYEDWKNSKIGSGLIIPNLKDLSVQDINSILGKFVVEVRKKNGEKYPAKTLYLLVTGLLRGMRSHGVSNLNFLNESDDRFLRFRQILDAQMKKLTSDGYGINVKQADPISVEQEEILWDKSVFGNHSSESLLHTVFFYNCKYFGLRGRDEHRNLQISQIQLGEDDNGNYIEFRGKDNKTYNGGLRHRYIAPKSVRQYLEKDCQTLKSYQMYMNAIYEIDKSVSSPFYRRPVLSEGSVKFDHILGANRLGSLMKTICQKGELKGNFSNHSGKRTLATRLYQAGVSEQMIMDRTGHRSKKAVRTYKRPADSMLKDVSNILNPSNKQIKLEDPKPLTDTRAILPEQVNMENTENAFNDSKPEGKYRGLPSNSSFQNCVFNFVTKM